MKVLEEGTDGSSTVQVERRWSQRNHTGSTPWTYHRTRPPAQTKHSRARASRTLYLA